MATFTFTAKKESAGLRKLSRMDSSPIEGIARYRGLDRSKISLRNKVSTAYGWIADVFGGFSDTTNPYLVGTLEYKAPLYPGGPSRR